MEEEYSDEELEDICNRVYDLGVEFSKSKYYERLTEEQKRESEHVIMIFTEIMYSYHGVSPEEWDEERLEECCLYTLPRKITADKSYYKSIAPVLSAFFEFVQAKGLPRNSSDLAERVREIDKQIVENAADPRNWGIAKSFLMAAKDAGVNIQDQKELNKFIQFYNSLQAQDQLEVAGHKIGRNDPCPCGSGKKYKKCCGRHHRQMSRSEQDRLHE
jgi:hypothetical protein